MTPVQRGNYSSGIGCGQRRTAIQTDRFPAHHNRTWNVCSASWLVITWTKPIRVYFKSASSETFYRPTKRQCCSLSMLTFMVVLMVICLFIYSPQQHMLEINFDNELRVLMKSAWDYFLYIEGKINFNFHADVYIISYYLTSFEFLTQNNNVRDCFSIKSIQTLIGPSIKEGNRVDYQIAISRYRLIDTVSTIRTNQ